MFVNVPGEDVVVVESIVVTGPDIPFKWTDFWYVILAVRNRALIVVEPCERWRVSEESHITGVVVLDLA